MLKPPASRRGGVKRFKFIDDDGQIVERHFWGSTPEERRDIARAWANANDLSLVTPPEKRGARMRVPDLTDTPGES